MSADFFLEGLGRYGIQGIAANAGLRAYGQMLTALKQGRIVFLMLDQGVKQAKDGQLPRFLGKDMPMPAGPAQLARAARAPVLPVATLAATPLAVRARSRRAARAGLARRPMSRRLVGAHRTDRARPAAALELAAAPLAQVPAGRRTMSDPPLWVLLGDRHGDNRQLLSIAEALGRPYRTVQLLFGRGARSRPARLSRTASPGAREPPLEPPWPRAVLTTRRKSVPAARWIRRASGGTTRLIHVNRPWAPLAWFDLIVTTPQYTLPERDNVLINLLPFVQPVAPEPLPASFAARAAALPRPWTVVLVGGNSRPFMLDESVAAGLLRPSTPNCNASVAAPGCWTAPHPAPDTLAALERGLEAPAQIVRWGRDENCYAALLGLADRFIVTADSASMLAEALLTGRPVTPFALPAKPDWHWRVGAAWRDAGARRSRRRGACSII